MPKSTFFNLKSDKKNKILESCKKEFSRSFLSNALVSNIVEDANIPRGSFYQYFDDIEDCFYYIVDEYGKDIKIKLLEYIKTYKGDILKSYYSLYIYILDLVEDKKNKNYFENLFLNMNNKTQKMFTPNFNEGLNNVINLIDISKLNISNKMALGYIFDIIESVMIHNVIESYNRNISKDKKIEIFEKEMLLISNGVIKKIS